MENKKIWLLMLILSMSTYCFSRKVEIEKIMVLSLDKTRLHIVENTIYSDTLKSLDVGAQIVYYINDFSLKEISKNGYFMLPDSTVPKWTHLFGDRKIIRHKLIIENNKINHVLLDTSIVKSNNIFIIVITALILFCFTLIGLMFRGLFPEVTRFAVGIVYCFFLLAYIITEWMTLFDALYLASVISAPFFIISFKKTRVEKQFNREFEMPKHKKPI